MQWLAGIIIILVLAGAQTAVGAQLTAMALTAMALRFGAAGLIWLAIWGGVVLERGLVMMMGLWLVTAAGLAYRRWGGEPRWWAGFLVAAGASGILRWVSGSWSVGGMVGDMVAFGLMWSAVSWWQERWEDKEMRL
jgi:hypothetical protein